LHWKQFQVFLFQQLLIYEDFAYHFRSKGKLRFEIEKSKLKNEENSVEVVLQVLKALYYSIRLAEKNFSNKNEIIGIISCHCKSIPHASQ